MMSPILLIAEREFRTYVATLSFWLSLAIAPLGAMGMLIFSGERPHVLVTIQASDPGVAQSTRKALLEAGQLEGQSFVFGQGGAAITLSAPAPHLLDVSIAADLPLSSTGRAMVRHVIERDAARLALGDAPLVARERNDPVTATDTGALSRLTTMAMLWLMLAGSLGMLLQAVARERANRALESLLACARPWQIVAGKMAGVGAVSMLVLTAWGGTMALVASFAARNDLVGAVLAGFSNPAMMARDAVIYLCAYFFYGAATVMLGTLARDSASAQNAARPMFILLLAGFFAAMASVGPASGPSWLTYVPPFTPFLLLVQPAQDVAVMVQVFVLGLLLFSALGMFYVAVRALHVASRNNHIFRWNFWRAQTLV